MKFEPYEWQDFWWDNAEKEGARVLLIGDSITRGYYPFVKEQLAGKYFVDRCSASTGPDSPVYENTLRLFLSVTGMSYEIIHLNNGLHAEYLTDEEYERQMAMAILLIRGLAPDARLVIATSTPYRSGADAAAFGDFNERVLGRNAAVFRLAEKYGLAVDDLYAVAVGKCLPTCDTVHYDDTGYRALADAVVQSMI